jgi:peptidoglycan hydrolase-like protein with peptidoglycan-binding domain
LKVTVRREIAALIPGLVRELEEARGKPFRTIGGFNCRSIEKKDIPSNHSWGLAIDLDEADNPQMPASEHQKEHPLRKTFPGGLVMRSTMPDQAQAIAARHGFNWGGLFRSPDPMHFEFLGTPDDARRLGGGTVPVDATQFPGVLQRGTSGPHVCRVQDRLRELGHAIDRRPSCPFGPQTEAAVKAFQASRGLPVDGKVDRATWDALFTSARVGESTTDPPPFPGIILERGSSGSDVCRVQDRLRALGHTIDRRPSCPFGPQTEGAVKAFQRSKNLVDDGRVGKLTWEALFT